LKQANASNGGDGANTTRRGGEEGQLAGGWDALLHIQKYTATRDRTHRFPKDSLELNAQMTEYNDSKTSIEQSNV
jgi:hypothetical protein